MTETWRKRRDRHGTYWYREERLHDGWKVRMTFWVSEYKEHCRNAEVEVSLVAYRGPAFLRWGWAGRKNGVVSGPGGTAVGHAALKMLREVEELAPEKTKRPYVDLYVTGASLRLYLAYRAVLKRRGYDDAFHLNEEHAIPELTKILR